MDKKGVAPAVIIAGVLIVLAIGGFGIMKSLDTSDAGEEVNPIKSDGIDNPSGGIDGMVHGKIVEITSDGFVPATLEINVGDKVTFVNRQSNPSWPASAMHPTHTIYPGSDIRKCGTSEDSKIFDSCNGLRLEESYSFTFNEAGEWGYHDHLRPSWLGKIIVNE